MASEGTLCIDADEGPLLYAVRGRDISRRRTPLKKNDEEL